MRPFPLHSFIRNFSAPRKATLGSGAAASPSPVVPWAPEPPRGAPPTGPCLSASAAVPGCVAAPPCPAEPCWKRGGQRPAPPRRGAVWDSGCLDSSLGCGCGAPGLTPAPPAGNSTPACPCPGKPCSCHQNKHSNGIPVRRVPQICRCWGMARLSRVLQALEPLPHPVPALPGGRLVGQGAQASCPPTSWCS